MKIMQSISKLGWIFLGLALLLSVFMFFFISYMTAPYEKYDYEKISKEGIALNAKIEVVNKNYNKTINNINPTIITYSYVKDNYKYYDKFSTIDLNNYEQLTRKDSIRIFVHDDKSVIDGLEPAKSTIQVLWGLPVIFAIVGIFLVLSGYIKRQLP